MVPGLDVIDVSRMGLVVDVDMLCDGPSGGAGGRIVGPSGKSVDIGRGITSDIGFGLKRNKWLAKESNFVCCPP